MKKKIKNSRVRLHFCSNRCLLEQVCWSWRSRSISTSDCLGMIAVPYCFHEDPYRMINFWIIQLVVRCLLQEIPSPCGVPDVLFNTANQSSSNYLFFTGWGPSCANINNTALTSDPKWGKTASIFLLWPYYKWLNALLMGIRNAKKAVMFAWKKLMSESLDLLFSSIL